MLIAMLILTFMHYGAMKPPKKRFVWIKNGLCYNYCRMPSNFGFQISD